MRLFNCLWLHDIMQGKYHVWNPRKPCAEGYPLWIECLWIPASASAWDTMWTKTYICQTAMMKGCETEVNYARPFTSLPSLWRKWMSTVTVKRSSFQHLIGSEPWFSYVTQLKSGIKAAIFSGIDLTGENKLSLWFDFSFRIMSTRFQLMQKWPPP